LQVYQFNFITVASWLIIFILASLFLWGNVLRLLGCSKSLICFSGGHTIGISHCPAVSRQLYNSTGPRRIDLTMDSKHVENLKILATTHSCSKEGVGCEPKLILFSIVPERNPQPSSHPSI
ncbi:hypothetical protein ES288_A10G289700v1, partial [Gossypium darwinii]